MASNWNVLMEGMARTDFSEAEYRVLVVIARKTFGFRKHTDAISLSQIGRLTGLRRRSIQRALSGSRSRTGLIHREVVYRSGVGHGRGNTYSYTINLDPSSWKEAPTVESTEKVSAGSPFTPLLKGDPTSKKKATQGSPTRGTSTREGAPTPSGRPISSFTNADIFDVFEAAGGTFYSDDGRKKFGTHINTARKRGFERDVVLAAAREVGRKNGFGLLAEIEAIRSNGMPCIHAGLVHMALTVEQLRECPCATCAEWVAHRQRANLTVLKGGKSGAA